MPAPIEQRQRWWGDRLTTARHDGLMRRATGRDIPRLESIRAGDCSGAWMTCVPSVMHNTLIPSSEYVSLIKWHVGIPQLPPDSAGQRCGPCGRPIDPHGDHAVSCSYSRLHERHLGVQSYICQVLQESKVVHAREQTVDATQSRPADILLTSWRNGQDMAIDITVVHSNPVQRVRTAGSAASVLRAADAHKRREHGPACARAGVLFEPLVLDTWGGLHGASRGTWKSIVAAATRGSAHTLRAARSGKINQGLSVAVMRGVARQLAMTSLASDPNTAGEDSADNDAADDAMQAESDQDAP